MNDREHVKQLRELETRTGHTFRRFDLLVTAVTHSSYANEHHMTHKDCNERLEFLGDAVLELVSSEYLYNNYQEIPEGDLSRLRASLVCEPTLAFDAQAIELGKYLLLGRGEDAAGGRKRESIVSDALEAVIGAIFLDGGFEEAKAFILKYIMNDVEKKRLFRDSKTRLQEILQAISAEEISYTVIDESGPDHNKSFRVQVAQGGKVLGTGEGRSKKAAEQKAAYDAIVAMHKEDPDAL
ncbi:MAG: ribonuclease III [Eubacterium sp.]|nr:ribonuclease III [Eubacterium sp.]